MALGGKYTLVLGGVAKQYESMFSLNAANIYALLTKREVKIYGLLTKREVRMAGYWPSSFFACLWTESKSKSINTQKRTRRLSSHLDRTSLVNKGFIIWLLLRLWGNFSCGTQRVIPSGQDSSILPARVANHSARFGSFCPLTEPAI